MWYRPALCWIITVSSPGPSSRHTTIPATSTTAATGPPAGCPDGTLAAIRGELDIGEKP